MWSILNNVIFSDFIICSTKKRFPRISFFIPGHYLRHEFFLFFFCELTSINSRRDRKNFSIYLTLGTSSLRCERDIMWYRFHACILIIGNYRSMPNCTLAYRGSPGGEYRREKLGFEIAWGLGERIVSTKEAINANEDITTRNCSPPARVFDLYTLFEVSPPKLWRLGGSHAKFLVYEGQQFIYARKCNLSTRKSSKRIPLLPCRESIQLWKWKLKKFDYDVRNKNFLFSFFIRSFKI